MSEVSTTGAGASMLDDIRRQLESLERTADGLALYNLIERGLQRYGGAPDRLERAFATYLYTLLGQYARNPQCDPATRIEARLMQQRLALHLSAAPPQTATTPAPAPSEQHRASAPPAPATVPQAAKKASLSAPTPVATPPSPAGMTAGPPGEERDRQQAGEEKGCRMPASRGRRSNFPRQGTERRRRGGSPPRRRPKSRSSGRRR